MLLLVGLGVLAEHQGGARLRLLGATWWDALTAVGTVLAVFSAVCVAVYEGFRARRSDQSLRRNLEEQAQRERIAQTEQEARERIAVASLVAGVVEQTYEVSEDRSHYVRQVILALINESPEPVFDLAVVVAKSHPPIPVGPLAVPASIPVLPSQTRRSWDISFGIVASGDRHPVLGTYPTVEVLFTDSKGVRWERSYDGSLVEFEVKDGLSYHRPESGERQLGELGNHFNPMPTVLAFLHALREDDVGFPDVEEFVSPTTRSWAAMAPGDYAHMAARLKGHGLAAHAWYPAPRVAWVRTLHDDVVNGTYSEKITIAPSETLTLCFLPDLGWRVFGVGAALEPDWIPFPAGSLSDDPRGGAATSGPDAGPA
ncbi:hypothetical protein V2J56_08240 [Georgenia sp. MJ206]|uniref:hypothetical protein n=1 Tax=Georgenia wangjunii TaxID=3117730 RepID=UPI002F26CC46